MILIKSLSDVLTGQTALSHFITLKGISAFYDID